MNQCPATKEDLRCARAEDHAIPSHAAVVGKDWFYWVTDPTADVAATVEDDKARDQRILTFLESLAASGLPPENVRGAAEAIEQALQVGYERFADHLVRQFGTLGESQEFVDMLGAMALAHAAFGVVGKPTLITTDDATFAPYRVSLLIEEVTE